MNFLARLGLLIALAVSGLLIGCKDQSQKPLVDTFDTLHVKEISGWRILHIRKERRSIALEILGNRPVVALSDAQLNELFPAENPESTALLRKEVGEKRAELARLEKDLAKPVFANNPALREAAESLKKDISYFSGLANVLRPYLLMAKLCSDLPGSGFTAFVDLRTGNLLVNQGCLSRSEIIPWHEPVVVYSEATVTRVEASVDVDE